MAMAIPFIMAAGAVVSAMGAMQEGKARETAALYNAKQEEHNAKLATDQAEQDAARFGIQYRRHEGAMIAQFGASGLTAEGTESVLADSAMNARLDEETIKYKGKIRALGFYNSATLNRFSGDTAKDQAQLQSASALLTGVGHAGSTWAASSSRLRQSPSRGTSSFEVYDDDY